MRVIYQGADITDDISIAGGWIEHYSLGRSDKLTITFGDIKQLWNDWGPKPGDTIDVEYGQDRTGEMEIVNVRPESSKITMIALSVPNAASTERRSKSWQDVHFLQLASEICNRYDLTLDTYNIDDHTYEYVEQNGISDFAFFSKRCALEGYGLLVFDRKMIVYGAEEMDAQSPTGTIEVEPGDDYKIMDDNFERFGRCKVTDGNVTGNFVYDDGKEFSYILADRMRDINEANRFARGLLRHKNRMTKHVRVTTDSFLSQYAPGSVVDFKASAVGSWDGAAFIEVTRFDLWKQKTMIELRPVITGY